jgi:dTDP-4-dehydrorhamnose reductase
MRILLIGALGQLGTDLRKVLTGHEVIPVDIEDIDIRDPRQVDAMVDDRQPDLLLNCAAFNRVDEAEDTPEAAFAVNTFAVRNLALAARRRNAALVHFSSDYVFDGPGRQAYVEDDLPSPKSVYGISKLSGEAMVQAVCSRYFLVRTCGLYGYTGSRDKGTNFVEAMFRLAAGGKPIRVVNDQVCTPTSTMDLACAVAQLIGTDCYGLYHLTSGGECTWYEFAKAIFESAGLQPEVEPVASGEFRMKAKRPTYSVLDNRHFRDAGFADMRHWRESLAEYVQGRKAAGLQ